ncbi:MAG TPA: hypothetical protein PK995_01960 [Bacteroidia bacterium]|nr:hypothetical protein [Bacteroidia bacterium]
MKTHTIKFSIAVILILFFNTCRKDNIEVSYGNYPAEIGKIISTNCTTGNCHNAKIDATCQGSELDLTSWNNLFTKGAHHGSPVIPYSSKYSYLLYHINTYSDLNIPYDPNIPLYKLMPQYKNPLSKEDVIKIKQWIDNGAPDNKGNVYGSNVYDKIYIVNQGCDVVTVFDAKTQLPIRMIEVGSNPDVNETPHFINFSPDGKYWYIVYINSPYLEKYDANTDKLVGRCNLNNQVGWTWISITKDGKKGFCIDWESNGKIVSVDLEKMKVINSMYGLYFPHGAALSKNDDTLYVAARTGNFFMKIDTSLTTHIDIPIDNSGTVNYSSSLDLHDVFVSKDGNKIYFTCEKSNEVREFDLTTNSVSHIIPMGIYPQHVAYSPLFNTIYVSCELDPNNDKMGSIVAINLNNYTTQKVYVGYQPHRICIDEKNKVLYLPNRNLIGNGVPPHHTSVCNGKNGFVTILNLPDLSIKKNQIELSIDTYFAIPRP